MMNNKNVKIIVGLILCVVVFFVYNKISHSGDATYKNVKYNYSFQYPKSWSISSYGKVTDSSDVVTVFSGSNRFTIVHFANTKNYSPDKWYALDSREKLGDGNYPYPKAIVLSEGIVSFKGLPAYKVTTNDAGLSYDYFITKGNDIYILSFERYDGENISKTQLYFDKIESSLVLN